MSCFQILDNKGECYGIYTDNGLSFDGDFPNQTTLERTWDYHPLYEAEYAKLYVNGQNIADICPPQYERRWQQLKDKKNAFVNSFKNAKIDLNKHCFFDLVPETFLEEYNYIKNEITKWVFENYERPDNYEFLEELTKLAYKISSQTLQFDTSRLQFVKLKTKSSYSNYINYNPFGTVTGRLTTTNDSFPILTLNKEYRDILVPKNNFFLEIDVNAADIRSFLALLGKEQPKCDIHDWNNENLFDNQETRESAKSRFFSWFYNPNKHDKDLLKVYDRDYLLQRHFNGKTVRSPFGRTIQTDDYHALSYLVQATSNDIILRNIIKLDKLLEGRKSFISFMIHDSVVIDWHSDDISLQNEIYNCFSQTDYGEFPSTMSIGFNFKNMEELQTHG